MLLARYDVSPADTHYYHHDGLGSIMGMTDENGAVEQSYFYDEFGNSLGAWGSVGNHYLYTGQEYEGSITGLYNLRARYYAPAIGRFISEDPMNRVSKGIIATNPNELNAYLYVQNNPINQVDPLGLKGKCTLGDVYIEMTKITAAFRACCKPSLPIVDPCYGKIERILDCMYITLGGNLDCCDYGFFFLPIPYHWGVGVECYDCCGYKYEKIFEPWSCWELPYP